MFHKVFAYITRQSEQGLELLVFKHRDYPDPGIQVPAGSVEDGEVYEAAALRETFEESGLSNFTSVQDLGEFVHTRFTGDAEVTRHFFHMQTTETLPDHFEHTVSAGTNDTGLVFQYFWIPLSEAHTLAGEQGLFSVRIVNNAKNVAADILEGS